MLRAKKTKTIATCAAAFCMFTATSVAAFIFPSRRQRLCSRATNRWVSKPTNLDDAVDVSFEAVQKGGHNFYQTAPEQQEQEGQSEGTYSEGTVPGGTFYEYATGFSGAGTRGASATSASSGSSNPAGSTNEIYQAAPPPRPPTPAELAEAHINRGIYDPPPVDPTSPFDPSPGTYGPGAGSAFDPTNEIKEGDAEQRPADYSVEAMENRIARLERELSAKLDEAVLFDQIRAKEVYEVKRMTQLQLDEMRQHIQRTMLENDELRDIRDFETVEITWNMAELANGARRGAFNSHEFPIAGYNMNMRVDVDQQGQVSFYFNHCSGFNMMPINMVGSKVRIVAPTQEFEGDLPPMETPAMEHVGGSDFQIREQYSGVGWQGIIPLEALLQNFVHPDGTIHIEASVRVQKIRRIDVSK